VERAGGGFTTEAQRHGGGTGGGVLVGRGISGRGEGWSWGGLVVVAGGRWRCFV